MAEDDLGSRSQGEAKNGLKKLSGDHSYTEEIAETLKSILFWQKVIVVLFVAGLFLLDGMRPYL